MSRQPRGNTGTAQPHANPPKAKKKPGGSLVWKLTLRQTSSLIWILALLNAAIILLFSAAVFIRCEEVAVIAAAGSAAEEAQAVDPRLPAPLYTVSVQAGLPEGGISLSHIRWAGRTLGVSAGAATRRLSAAGRTDSWYDSLDSLEYTVAYPLEEGAHTWVTFDLGSWVRGFKLFFHPFLIFQGVVLFFAIGSTRRAVKRALRPIQELTLTAQSMTAAEAALKMPKKVPPPPAQPQPKLQLSGAIDTLNTINEDRLDTRIAISDKREELRGLASAINNMLDRLNAAYQSQLRFVSDASHELRTPIAVIQGYANLLDRWGKTDEKTLQESIDAIKAEASGMQDLVEQLLFLARSDNNSIAMNLEEVDISALAWEVLRDAGVIDQTHRLSAQIEEHLLVWGDQQLLKQAMRILMDNAIKYTPAGERIVISARDGGEDVEVAVTDHGIGIPAGDLDRVFDRFFRADESRARKSGGTGLGLSIAKWIIDRHGGFVEVLSRQDLGTRMTFHLPKPQKLSAEAGGKGNGEAGTGREAG